MENQDQHEDAQQDRQGQIDLVHRFFRLRHQELQRQGARAEGEADENGLGQRVVQARQDGGLQGDGGQPIGDASEDSHCNTIIHIFRVFCKQKALE